MSLPTYFHLSLSSFTLGVFLWQPLPVKSSKRYVNKNQTDVILQVSDGGFWSAKCIIKNLDKDLLPKSAGLYSGWSAFAAENNLEEGYIGIFDPCY